MTRLPFGRLIAACLALPLVAGVATFVVGLYVNPGWLLAASLATMGTISILGGVPVLRWWAAVERRAGIVKSKTTRSKASTALDFIAALVVCLAIVYSTFATTGSRIAEGAATVAIVFPLSTYLTYRTDRAMPPPKPQESSSLKFSYRTFIVGGVLFAIDLGLRSSERGYEPGLRIFHEVVTATSFVLIAAIPMIVYEMRQRYLRARNLRARSEIVLG